MYLWFSPSDSLPAVKICKEDVCRLFHRQKIRKVSGPGPDSVSPVCWRFCTNQLEYQESLEWYEAPSCFPLHHHISFQETLHNRTKWLQAHCLDVCGHELLWETGLEPAEGHYLLPAGPPSVCLPGQQVSGWCSLCGPKLHPATARLPRDIHQDSAFGFQLAVSTPSSLKSFTGSSPISTCQ